jgi:hypothetical protein
MNDTGFTIIAANEARKVLTNGDVRSDVAFQNDVNLLLAALEELCEAAPASPSTGRAA